MKAPINSVKHIVQISLDLIGEQTRQTYNLVKAVDTQPSAPNEVDVGAVVKAVWCEFWLLGESSQPCTATWIVEKIPNNVAGASQTDMQALHSYNNKKNILKMGQGIISDSNTNPIPVIREWVKIPKGKQRMGLGDNLNLTVSCIGETDNGLELCGFGLYKAYT